MGIHSFFYWYKTNYPQTITTIKSNDTLKFSIDTLALDLNGIFHPAAQQVYQYGNYKGVKSLLRKVQRTKERDREVYKQVCKVISELIHQVNPKKRIILCVDGVAGLSKMTQQKQRRFRSAKENSDCVFDSCSITPGTEFMHEMTRYIDWYIVQCMNKKIWGNTHVIFSNEKVPGEGEKKCLDYIRSHCHIDETICIHGLDADLIMLGLALTPQRRVYILREDLYNPGVKHILDIGSFAQEIEKKMSYTEQKTLRRSVIDFVFMCFFVGNDFLPQLPCLEIFRGGIDLLIDIYKEYCPNGIIDTYNQINMDSFLKLCNELAKVEIDELKNKFKQRDKYIDDPLLNTYFKELRVSDKEYDPYITCDFDGYRDAYYTKKIGKHYCVDTICKEYIKGLQWVIMDYTSGIPSWTWCYPFQHGPFLLDLAKTISYTYIPFAPSSPCEPFQQLLSVLPPKSMNLLPPVLANLALDTNSPLRPFYPDDFEIDVAGKRADWMGIVILPMTDIKLLKSVYRDAIGLVTDKQALKRNRLGKIITYSIQETSYHYKHFYGSIQNCIVRRKRI